ncbi:hypothetical protein STENM327S_08214 [Streptomyces tendae]
MPISPNQGSTGGGTLVTITGTNLSGTTAVTFGTRPATSITNVSPTQVTAVPRGRPGPVTVSVTTAGGISPRAFLHTNRHARYLTRRPERQQPHTLREHPLGSLAWPPGERRRQLIQPGYLLAPRPRKAEATAIA